MKGTRKFFRCIDWTIGKPFRQMIRLSHLLKMESAGFNNRTIFIWVSKWWSGMVEIKEM
jgi:hypothetical protein